MEALNETIETAIKNITDVVREELVDLVYTRKIDMLMKELNKCKSEMVQYKLSHTNSSTSNCDDIVVSNENITLEIEDISICEDNLNVIDFDDEEEFKCEKCSTVQGKNNCGLCDVEDVCEECHGQGGDYGPNEIWVCNECLPTCLDCKSQLSTVYDTCCRNRRSDDEKKDDVFGMDNEQVEDLIKEEASEAVEEGEDKNSFEC